jgi:hypothetical protein
MTFALVDFFIQIIFQMPIPWIIDASHSNWIVELILGIRLVWHKTDLSGVESRPFSFSHYIESESDDNTDGFAG